jgi:hypothetical protein
MKKLNPEIYREASVMLSGNPARNSWTDAYACNAIKTAIENRLKRNKKKVNFFNIENHSKPYIEFLFLVYCPHLSTRYSIWGWPSQKTAGARKIGLHFLAEMVESGMNLE